MHQYNHSYKRSFLIYCLFNHCFSKVTQMMEKIKKIKGRVISSQSSFIYTNTTKEYGKISILSTYILCISAQYLLQYLVKNMVKSLAIRLSLLFSYRFSFFILICWLLFLNNIHIQVTANCCKLSVKLQI